MTQFCIQITDLNTNTIISTSGPLSEEKAKANCQIVRLATDPLLTKVEVLEYQESAS